MDAKPQRPFRALRVRDENLPPSNITGQAKSIHQRNKSTPALSTLIAQGANKAGLTTKRTVFADVSNTSRPVQAKDDMVLQGKAGVKTFDTKLVKDIAKSSEKFISQPLKPTALRLSQKNLPAPVKQAPLITADSTDPSVNPEHATGEAQAEIKNICGGAAKRQTTIFREDSADVQSAKQGPSESYVETRPRAATTTYPAPVHQALPPRREKSEPSIISEPKEDVIEGNGPYVEEQEPQSNMESLLPLLRDDNSSQGLYHQSTHISDKSHMPMPYSAMQMDQIANIPTGFPNYSVVQLPGQSHPVMVSFDGAQTGQYGYVHASKMMPLPAGLPTPEPEEYWDEEEEEEYYEVDGYTTT
ncbi:hypothetical protein LTS18_007307, partial [Coniosporium uncinatum]